MTTAVVLGAGRGTRMRATSDGVELDPRQEQMANLGLKALIPFHGHPFLSYVLTSLADAGYATVCLVVGPRADPIRMHYEAAGIRRLDLRFAVQHAPLGSAHALLAAEPLIQQREFVLINGDNLYPLEALTALRALESQGLVAFRRCGLLRGNITPDRLRAYALVTTTPAGDLAEIVEKPSTTEPGHELFSMTCWRFAPSIFAACRAIPLSPRGEYELPDAVRHAMRAEHERFRILELDSAVLDLSRRCDIPVVEQFLSNARVEL